MKKWFAVLLAAAMLLGLVGCGGNTGTKRPLLQVDTSGRQVDYTFDGQAGEPLRLSPESARRVLDGVEAVTADYFLSDMYQLEEVKKRLDFDASVESHSACALNADGKLDAAHLATLVKANNQAFMAGKPFGYKVVEDDYIAQLCEFTVQVVEKMAEKYPQVDWQRVYCNLGNLKILYDTGMLSYAQVKPGMILAISKNNTEIVLTLKGEDGFSRVLTHEIMHIIQIGCVCEKVENGGRRAGIAMYWEDFPLNTTDWTWMVEGAAERHMCSLTGGEAVSYQYKMDYLCSLTMSVLLRQQVEADTMEVMTLLSDPQLLFDAFGAETETQREEVLNMMITLQILQMQPKYFHQVYKEKTGVDLQADSDAMDRFSYSLKPAICVTLAKEFYENLTMYLQENALPVNDLFFLINLFEGHLNQHLSYKNESKAEVNAPFFAAYRQLRSALFAALAEENDLADPEAAYTAYEISAGEGKLNAALTDLPAEKRTFLAERAQWQAELNGLGVKVPQ